MSNIVAVDPRPSLVTGNRPAAIVPTDMDSAYRLGKAICLAGMAPKGMDTPEKCMIAIMRGMEVGLTPFMALDKIAIVNGRPTIWGDGAIGLVRGSGLCEFIKERIEGTGDTRMAVCEANRHLLPASGPLIINDVTGLPWTANEYRRKWRLVATKAGVPKNVWNMDSRSGAISEAIQAGAPIEFVRHAATHSDVSQTADYDRTQAESTAKVMKLRAEARNRPKTEHD